jgi:hypothetical protein
VQPFLDNQVSPYTIDDLSLRDGTVIRTAAEDKPLMTPLFRPDLLQEPDTGAWHEASGTPAITPRFVLGH